MLNCTYEKRLSEMGRKIIGTLNISVDGFIEGPNGEMDWVMMEDDETWRDLFEMLTHVDTFILGPSSNGLRAILARSLGRSRRDSPLSGRVASKNEIAFAHLADSRQHLVLSRTLDKVAWKTTRVVRDVDEIRKIKSRPARYVRSRGCYAGFEPNEPRLGR